MVPPSISRALAATSGFKANKWHKHRAYDGAWSDSIFLHFGAVTGRKIPWVNYE
jgi:hypothetical protein